MFGLLAWILTLDMILTYDTKHAATRSEKKGYLDAIAVTCCAITDAFHWGISLSFLWNSMVLLPNPACFLAYWYALFTA